MRAGRKNDRGSWAVAMLLLAPCIAAAGGRAQAPRQPDPPLRMSMTVERFAPTPGASAEPGGEIVREIDDPRNGDRWLLMRNDSHPGGPGLLLLISAARGISPHPAPSKTETAEPAPIIRAGDRVIVEENTPVAEARLEAVALNPALSGAAFNARLIIGGRVVRAVATGPGRATFQGETDR
jgi:hypothetical protein